MFSFLFFFWPHSEACRILIPWPGIEHVLPVLGTWSLNPLTAREVPKLFVFLLLSFESSLYIIYLLSDIFLQRHFSPMFSSTHCVVVVVMYRSTVYVGLIFAYSVKDGWSFVFLFLPFLSFFVAIAVYKFSIVPVPFVEEASLSPLHCFCNFVKTQVLYMYRFASGYFILFHCFICLSLCQYHALLITRVLD